jgi:hypothetical protein
MDAGPDALRQHEPRLGASTGEPDLGPISPELALVDPELARRARELLPKPQERPRARRPRPEAPVTEVEPQPEVRRRRRWPQTIALAIVIFVAGAASGTLLGNDQNGSPGTTLEVRAVGPATTQTTVKRPALRPPKIQHAKTVASVPPQRRRHARIDWSANVLGVEARVGRNGVVLLWLSPADSARVVVLRRREGGSGATVVFRGRAARFHDSSARPCTAYLYTIVNYDQHGHRSTGVPTSVVTRCG